MAESRFIKLSGFLTKKANKAELEYRNKLALKDERTDTLKKWENRILNGRLGIIPYLEKKQIRFFGNILELGAGMCWFSSELPKIKQVNEIYALEFSEVLLKEVAPHIMDFLNADKTKIVRVLGDFYNLKLKKKYFDFVVFDAALHHVEFLNDVFKEIDTVIKKNGVIIAIREPVLPELRKWNRNKFGQEDKKYGVTEMIFTMKEWKFKLNELGYDIQFIPYAPTNKLLHKLVLFYPLSLLNKYLFGNFVFVIKKRN